MRLRQGLKVVALFEAGKGLLVLLAGFGLLGLLHRDLQHIAEQLVRLSHLNPASHYPRIFIDTAARITDQRLWVMAGMAFAYALVRLVEGYGLWRGRRWAEWFAAVAGGIYVPMELSALWAHPTAVRGLALVANTVVVIVMLWSLWRSRGAGAS